MSCRSTGDYRENGDAAIEMDVLLPPWSGIRDRATDLSANARKPRTFERLQQKHAYQSKLVWSSIDS
ncbi:hypothetical protein ANO14919_023540 [Xylariales sp. No.14919]|nr:hypothetical protein ANO14919_023540 [Xylariales sp. No.14919]